jgi:hypothetical protein
MNTRSIPREDVKAAIRRRVEDLLIWTDGATRSCINCSHFDEKNELCKKFNQRPPARVIALACSNYEDCDDIPF